MDLKNITIDEIPLKVDNLNGVEAFLLRLDKIDPVISGNKWFKLKLYLEEALSQNKSTILTYGGAWSNHIVATAAACKLNNLQSIGLIRGEMPAKLSDTLVTAMAFGMKLFFISRSDYKAKLLPAELPISPDDLYVINEGGYGNKGALGAATISEYYDRGKYTHLVCAAGTGTMMAGLIKSAVADQVVMGISVFKNNFSLDENIARLLTAEENKKLRVIIHDYHFGGYAKHDSGLLHFMNEFYRQTSIPTDFVYTAKLLFGLNDLVSKNYFPRHSRILVIHSGGLQGNNSLVDSALIF